MIMCDQLAPQFLPFYGHPLVNTPALSKLADEGVVFDSAYCNSPLCAPSRFSLMAGRLCSEIDAWDNAAEMRAELPTIAHYLRAGGYRTAPTFIPQISAGYQTGQQIPFWIDRFGITTCKVLWKPEYMNEH